MMTGKKYIDFFRSMPSGRGNYRRGNAPGGSRAQRARAAGFGSTGRCGARGRGTPGPRAPTSQSARRAASRHQGRPLPLPARSPRPSAPLAPPSRSPVAVRTHPRRSPSSAPSSSAPGGSATIPERSRCRDGGGASGRGGGAQVGTAPQVGAGIVGRGVLAPPPGVQSPPVQSDFITDYLLVIRGLIINCDIRAIIVEEDGMLTALLHKEPSAPNTHFFSSSSSSHALG